MNFSYQNSTLIQFGEGKIATLAQLIDAEKRVLLIYGGGSIKQNGIYDSVMRALSHVHVIEHSGIGANPTKAQVDEAVLQVKQGNIDLILAVGGGSVIDAAKYISVAGHYEGDGWDILTGAHTPTQATDIGVVLTLPATGSETNIAGVLTHQDLGIKLGFLSPLVRPKFAIMQPSVVQSLPRRQIINGLVDAFIHVCEQYLTLPSDSYVHEGYAETLLRSLLRLGNQLEPNNPIWQANLMLCANQALNGFIGTAIANDWATHMIGHELTAIWGVDHARSLAIIQPSLLRHQRHNKKQKLEQMARNVFGFTGKDAELMCIEAIEAFYQGVGMNVELTEREEPITIAIDKIIARLTQHGYTALGESKQISLEDVQAILHEALHLESDG